METNLSQNSLNLMDIIASTQLLSSEKLVYPTTNKIIVY